MTVRRLFYARSSSHAGRGTDGPRNDGAGRWVPCDQCAPGVRDIRAFHGGSRSPAFRSAHSGDASRASFANHCMGTGNVPVLLMLVLLREQPAEQVTCPLCGDPALESGHQDTCYVSAIEVAVEESSSEAASPCVEA